MDKLSKYRKQVDKINLSIIKLIAKRIKISVKIGKYKKSKGIKIFDKKREKQVFAKLKKDAVKNKLDSKIISNIFKEIIRYSRKVQLISTN